MLKRFILSGMLIFVFSSTLSAQSVDEGYQALRNGDYKTALNIFEPLAAKNDAAAQTGLAVMYYEGLGVSRDEKKAVALAQRTAKRDHAVAQYILYDAYQYGKGGLTRDEDKAFDWLQTSAENGYPQAQITIARMFFEKKDYYRSFNWSQIAAKRNVANAMTLVGNHYALGAGVARDSTQAFQWYKRAAEFGDAEGQYWLAEMYLSGQGVAKDGIQGRKWMAESARQGYEPAKKRLNQQAK
jgi:hypothetical protein